MITNRNRNLTGMVATLKKRHIQKIEKTSRATIKKLLNPKYGPNRPSSFRDMHDTDRQTDMSTRGVQNFFAHLIST